ncbi:hypothetical protein [Pedobacter sp. SYP-B3415]|uniref:hypothetical protein n=1 Tax=Pedobacter sp. SYP-B3415 TaxID=2496641 RepID=UPI00101C5DEE|nr:hypothetical protein [Pedobacter sp. SYP-B3415]
MTNDLIFLACSRATNAAAKKFTIALIGSVTLATVSFNFYHIGNGDSISPITVMMQIPSPTICIEAISPVVLQTAKCKKELICNEIASLRWLL